MLNCQERIIEYLKNNKEGIFLKELSKKLNVSYPTILKHCDILVAQEKIKIKYCGRVKLIWV